MSSQWQQGIKCNFVFLGFGERRVYCAEHREIY